MTEENFLIIARNTGQMLLVDKVMRDNSIKTEIVPAPPRPGMACTKAVKISGADLDKAKYILDQKKIGVNEILKNEELKLQAFLNEKTSRA